MEIGPIAGIPLITTIKPSTAVPDPSRVFAVEFRKQAQDESADEHRAARGLEDEESEDTLASAEDEDPPEETAPDRQPPTKISFFA